MPLSETVLAERVSAARAVHRGRTILLSALAIVAAYAALQYWWFPPDGFLTGDQGTKFLEARAVLQNGPLHPWIQGPGLDVDTARRWQEPFLMRQGTHLVGVFPWLFAVLTAPFLGIFGLRGLYVVPALSVAATFIAASRIGRDLGQPHGGVWSGWCAVLATPMLVYGAELWEHAPAVALTTTAAALMMPGAPRPAARYTAAGVCLALAGVLRAEAFAMIPALVVARLWASMARDAAADTDTSIAMSTDGRGSALAPQTRERPGVRVWRIARGRLARDLLALGCGGAAAGGIIALGNMVIYGRIVPYQVSSNMMLGLPYLAVRSDALMSLVLPVWHRKIFVLALLVLAGGLCATPLAVRVRAAHVAVLTLLVVGIGVPLWRTHVEHLPWLAAFGTRNLAHTWPFVFVLAYWAAFRCGDGRERFVFAAAGAFLLFAFAAMPHIGGAQWSARFFLPAAPLAAALAVQVMVRAKAAAGGSHVLAIRSIGGVAIAASIGVQVYGLVFLETFKSVNARITHMTSSLAAPGDVVVSDLFWFPEVTATLYPTRRLLFAWSPADVAAIAARAASVGVPKFWIATSTDLTGYVPPPVLAGPDRSTRFLLRSQRDMHASSLTLYEYSREP